MTVLICPVSACLFSCLCRDRIVCLRLYLTASVSAASDSAELLGMSLSGVRVCVSPRCIVSVDETVSLCQCRQHRWRPSCSVLSLSVCDCVDGTFVPLCLSHGDCLSVSLSVSPSVSVAVSVAVCVSICVSVAVSVFVSLFRRRCVSVSLCISLVVAELLSSVSVCLCLCRWHVCVSLCLSHAVVLCLSVSVCV